VACLGVCVTGIKGAGKKIHRADIDSVARFVSVRDGVRVLSDVSDSIRIFRRNKQGGPGTGDILAGGQQLFEFHCLSFESIRVGFPVAVGYGIVEPNWDPFAQCGGKNAAIRDCRIVYRCRDIDAPGCIFASFAGHTALDIVRNQHFVYEKRMKSVSASVSVGSCAEFGFLFFTFGVFKIFLQNL